MQRLNHSGHATRTLFLLAAMTAIASAQAAPTFVNPLLTTVSIQASAVNGVGVHRNVLGSGPISDAASEMFGLSTADSSASVDALGLRAAASVHNASVDGHSAGAHSGAGIVNPFYLVARAGYTATTASIQIDYHLGGALNDNGCPTCFEFIQADLGVDGMADQFHFLGFHSMGTAGNPNGNVTGVNMGGALRGVVPLNTELYLRAGLYTGVHCQGPITCDASGLCGNSLRYYGFSSDAVDIVWGLAPAALPGAVPEPPTAWLMGLGLGLLLWLRRQQQ